MRAALLLTILLAGCAGAPGPQYAPDPRAGAGEPRAPGCDPSLLVIAHGGAAPLGDAPLACLMRTGVHAWEPNIGITERGAVFASARVYPNPGGRIGAAVSTDEGATWTLVEPSAAGAPTHPVSIDPYLYVDPATSRVFVDDEVTPHCSVLSWSDDDGATWDHSYSGCLEADHQTIFAGPPATSVTVGYPNVVYRCAINTIALAGTSTTSTCQRSLDGGRTWLPPGAPAYASPVEELPTYCDGALGHGIVDPTGRVWLPKGWCGQPWLAWSDDEGLTWTRVQVATNGMNRNPGGYPGHEAGVGVDAAGTVYYFWVAEDRLPYLAVSTDDGVTWSPPRVIAPPGVVETSLPALIVGGPGNVAIAYFGSTDSPGPPFPGPTCGPDMCVIEDPTYPEYEDVTWNGYLAMSLDADAADPTFFTGTVNPPGDPLVVGTCHAVRCGRVGDFIDVRIAPDGTPWAPFVDTHLEAPVRGDDVELVVGRLWGGPSLWGD